jgi:hypothetical protein
MVDPDVSPVTLQSAISSQMAVEDSEMQPRDKLKFFIQNSNHVCDHAISEARNPDCQIQKSRA